MILSFSLLSSTDQRLLQKLKDDLLESLLPADTSKKELERLRKRFIMKNSTTISLVGGRWRTQVVKWLIARGF
jgi:hypothetical protein